MMHWENFVGMGLGGFGFGWILMLLFWALLILGVVFLLKQFFGGGNASAAGESAEDILKKRYAAGEITKEEYNDNLILIKPKSGG